MCFSDLSAKLELDHNWWCIENDVHNQTIWALKIMARDGNCDFAQLRIKIVKMTLDANGVVVRKDVSGLNDWSSHYGGHVHIESWMQIKM